MTRTVNSTRLTVWGAGAAAVVAGGVMAGPPSADHISEHAKVMVHVDLDALNDSVMGDMLLSQLEADSNNFEELREVFPGFTLRSGGGLHGITAYAGGVGEDGPENMVVLIRGDEQLKGWEGRLSEMLAEHGGETVDINGHSTLVVPMDDETGYLTLLENDDDYTWVFGQSVASLTEGLGVMAGDKESVGGNARERIDRKWKGGTFAMFGTARLEVFEDMEEASAVLNLANEVWGRLGEVDGEFFAELTVHTEEEKKANQLVTVYNGAVMLGTILSEDNEELAEVMSLVQGFKVWAKDGYFTLSFKHDAEGLIEFIEEHAEGDAEYGDDDDAWGHDEDGDDDGWGEEDDDD